MKEKILVPLDGSSLSEDILHHVQRILVKKNAEVMLFYVMPEHPSSSPSARLKQYDEEDVLHRIRHLRNVLFQQSIDVSFEVRWGEPAEEILSFAEEWAATLIAMSTHGRTGLKRMLLGSVVEAVLRYVHCPMFLANPLALAKETDELSTPVRKILIPLDGSAVSAKIVPLACRFAKALDSEIVLLHVETLDIAVLADPAVSPQIPLPDRQEIIRHGDRLLSEHRRKLEGSHVKVTACSRVGPVEQVIHEAARELHADLIAMTTHGRSGLWKILIGSIAEKVFRGVHCPILLQRSGSRPSKTAPE